MDKTTEPSRVMRIQRRIYEILDGDVVDRASRWCEYFIATLVVLNVISIILESVPSLHEAYHAEFHAFDVFIVIVLCKHEHV